MRKLSLLLGVLLISNCLFAKDFIVKDFLTPDPNPKIGGTVRTILIGAPQSFNFYGTLDNNAYRIAMGDLGAPGSGLFSSLVEFNPLTYEIEPSLAESWKIKGKDVIFHLRDVKWSDGVPFTADDVLFTMKYFLQNRFAEGNSVDRFTINGKPIKWVKIDDHTIKAVLPDSYGAFMTVMCQALMVPKHKMEKLINPKDSGSVNRIWTTDCNPKDVVGTGPFMLEKYVTDQKVVLKKNPYYYKKDKYGNKLPYIDTFEYLVIKDPQAQLAKFLSGEVDYVTSANINASDYPTLKQKELDGADFIVLKGEPTKPTPSPLHIAFNFDAKNKDLAKLFRNLKFREAMEYALDRERIIEDVYNTLAVLGGCPVLPSNKTFFEPKIKKIRRMFDLDKAEEILDSIGVVDKNGDDLREFPNGKKLEMVLVTTSAYKEYQDSAYIYQQDLESIGIKVDLQIIDSNLLSQKALSGDYELALWAFGNQVDPQLRKAIWQPGNPLYYCHLSTMDKKTRKPIFENMLDWEKQVYKDFQTGEEAMKLSERQKAYRDWQMIYAEKIPFIFICKGADIQAVKKKIGNFYKTKDGTIVSSKYTIFVK
jgi:peptide/nickel transport system substrate-binding protein